VLIHFDAMCINNSDELVVGSEAAACWGAPGAQLLLTSDTHNWDDDDVATVVSSDVAAGTVTLTKPLRKRKTSLADLDLTSTSESNDHEAFAVEVASLDRNVVIRGSVEAASAQQHIGGHLWILHTPLIKQHIEGVLLQNMGQRGSLGRYPLHFHMSDNCEGSLVKSNVVRESNQRCFVVHGSHNLTLEDNVAYDTFGHCYMVEVSSLYRITLSLSSTYTPSCITNPCTQYLYAFSLPQPIHLFFAGRRRME
jgi:hypothetical protein